MGSGISHGNVTANKYKESGPNPTSNDHANVSAAANPDAPKRRTSLIPNTPHDVKVHSMISPSFTVDPSIAAAVPLAHATDEELLAEVARRKLNIRHNITDKVVKETYDIGEQIGKGASGVVLKVTNRQTREQFAMKVVEKNDSMNDLDSMMTEIEIMKRVRHRHIVCMYELYESPVCLWIVLEMVTGGSLHSFLMSAGDEYSEVMAARHIKQMLDGVHYLHSLGIIHRDLKVENILLQKVGNQLEVKIADFGLSAICAIGVGGYDSEHSVKRKKYNLCTELWGTKEYFAPELIDRAYGPQVDMWSLGCIAYEMLAGEPAFSLKKCRKEHILFEKIRRGDYSMQLGVWNEISSSGKDFVKSLLCVKATRRLCATEALNHPWIMESSLPQESDTPSPAAAPLLKQQSLRNVADNYRKNFAEDRKLKKGGSRFNLIETLPRDPNEEKSEPKSTVTSAASGSVKGNWKADGLQLQYDQKGEPSNIHNQNEVS